MWDNLHFFYLPTGLAIGVFCISRIIAAAFSCESQDSLRKRPITHGLLALIALGLIAVGLSSPFIPANREKWHSQRKLALAHVEEVGGWDAFKKDCQGLLSEAKATGQMSWSPGNMWGFSDRYRVLSSLAPTEIQVVSPSNQPSYVVMKLFEEKGGGRRSYYGLVYQETTNSDRCLAAHLFHGVSPKIIVDAVFEVY